MFRDKKKKNFNLKEGGGSLRPRRRRSRGTRGRDFVFRAFACACLPPFTPSPHKSIAMAFNIGSNDLNQALDLSLDDLIAQKKKAAKNQGKNKPNAARKGVSQHTVRKNGIFRSGFCRELLKGGSREAGRGPGRSLPSLKERKGVSLLSPPVRPSRFSCALALPFKRFYLTCVV
jgi:hypothetical protein